MICCLAFSIWTLQTRVCLYRVLYIIVMKYEVVIFSSRTSSSSTHLLRLRCQERGTKCAITEDQGVKFFCTGEIGLRQIPWQICQDFAKGLLCCFYARRSTPARTVDLVWSVAALVASCVMST